MLVYSWSLRPGIMPQYSNDPQDAIDAARILLLQQATKLGLYLDQQGETEITVYQAEIPNDPVEILNGEWKEKERRPIATIKIRVDYNITIIRLDQQ